MHTINMGRPPTMIDVDQVIVGERFRKDSDVTELAKNIKALGLINPITISPNNELICGYRRLCAYKLLGWKMIPCRVCDFPNLKFGEIAENGNRIDYNPVELVEIARWLKDHIGSLQGQRTDLAEESNFVAIATKLEQIGIIVDDPKLYQGRLDELIVEIVGFPSVRTMRRAETVIDEGTEEEIEEMASGASSISGMEKRVKARLRAARGRRTRAETASKERAASAFPPPPETPEFEGSPQADIAYDYIKVLQAADQPIPNKRDLAAATGVSHTAVEKALYRLHWEMTEELDMSSLTKRRQSEILKYKQYLDREFEGRVQKGVQDYVNNVVLPGLHERENKANRIIMSHRGVMTEIEFNKVIKCIHPDLIDSRSKDDLDEAFKILQPLKSVLVKETIPMKPLDLKKVSMEDLMARGRKPR